MSEPFKVSMGNGDTDYERHENDMDVIFRFFSDRRDQSKGGISQGAILTHDNKSPSPVLMLMCSVIAAAAYAQSEACTCKNCMTMKELCKEFSIKADATMDALTSTTSWH